MIHASSCVVNCGGAHQNPFTSPGALGLLAVILIVCLGVGRLISSGKSRDRVKTVVRAVPVKVRARNGRR